ncbi:MAG: flagellar basal body-associated FliL family protein [Dethiobacter sp.]|jgi:flagellar basal body-associated protein FliL|nr:flagellar basal body-associated FliL family protein [Dethiobacter sp.]
MKISDDVPTGKANSKKRGRGKLIVLILFAAIVLAGGFSSWHFYFRDKMPQREAKILTSAPMDFTVNLADSNQRRYLKAKIELGYTGKGLSKEIEKKIPEIRDLIILIFRTKNAAEIGTTEGTHELRLELREALNERLMSGEIVEVFFTEFIIQ